MLVKITSIEVDRESRQRRELSGIEELAESMHRLGLIHPIVVEETKTGYRLIAGERRLAAAKLLGWEHIQATLHSDLPELTKQQIELEENIKRKDISWQDQVAAVERLHGLMAKTEPDWDVAKTAEHIGYSKSSVKDALMVAKFIKDNQHLAKAQKFSTALNIVRRMKERRASSEIEQVLSEQKEVAVIHGDFLEWAKTYTGPKFNLIHCDFPFGINLHTSDQFDGEAKASYKDDPETYDRLLTALVDFGENFIAESAHLIFWFSLPKINETRKALSRLFVLDNFPLVWVKSDNTGIIPDANRGPRRIYETALFGTRGDRKVVRAVSNAYSAPSAGRNRIHHSEKPVPVLSYFFQMMVDESTTILDPTCGSGSALCAADALGAVRVLGLEIDQEMASAAQARVATARRLRNLK